MFVRNSPVGDFADIKGTWHALLGINLGSDEVPRFNKSEITKVETFQFFKEKPTQHWHKRRWEVAQDFLDRYMRQNIAEIDEIKYKEDVCDVQLRLRRAPSISSSITICSRWT